MAQLAISIQGVNPDLIVTEELLNVPPTYGTTTWTNIFHQVKRCMNRMHFAMGQISEAYNTLGAHNVR